VSACITAWPNICTVSRIKFSSRAYISVCEGLPVTKGHESVDGDIQRMRRNVWHPPSLFDNSSATPIMTVLKLHPEFYFEDGNIRLILENVLYNLHRGVLARHSDAFLRILGFPKREDSESQSEDSPDEPFRILSVKSLDFERLLRVVYPK
jgi:hypothetical protein